MGTQPLVFHSPDTNVLVAPATCGLVAVPDFLWQVRTWCNTDGETLVVDLSGVQELDMTMFRTLLWARRYCTARGRELVVVAPGEGVLQAEDEPMVRAMLPTYPDRLAAQGSLAAETVTAGPMGDPSQSGVPA